MSRNAAQRLTHNKKYCEQLKKKLRLVPRAVSLHVLKNVYQELVRETAVDSGQAAANWYIGFDDNSEAFKVMWGYTQNKGATVIQPIPPVGWKSLYSYPSTPERKTGDAEVIQRDRFTYLTQQMAAAPPTFKKIWVYNPITSGIPPEPSSGYPGNAMKLVYELVYGADIDSVVQTGIAEAKLDPIVQAVIK